MNNKLTTEQKKGISFLLLSKFFERLAFYLIFSVFIQYLTGSKKIPDVDANLIYVIFTGSIVLVSLFSGLLGDFFNRIKIVKAGLIILTLSYIPFIFIPNNLYLIIIVSSALGVGIGLTIPNIIVFLGNLFSERKNQIYGLQGFILYFAVIEICALISSLIAVKYVNIIGYNSLFLIAFAFGLISVFFFFIFERIYTKIDLFAENYIRSKTENKYKNLHIIILVSILIIPIFIRYALNQSGFTVIFYIRDYVENGFVFNPILNNAKHYISIILLILFFVFVFFIRKMNWKIIFSFILAGLTIGVIAYAVLANIITLKMNQNIVFETITLLTVSQTLIFSPVLYIIYRTSPIKYKGLFQGVSYIMIYFSNQLLFTGALLYEKTNPMTTFMTFSSILLVCAVLIFVLMKIVRKKEIQAIKRDLS